MMMDKTNHLGCYAIGEYDGQVANSDLPFAILGRVFAFANIWKTQYNELHICGSVIHFLSSSPDSVLR